jgi:hypothetical protein
MRPQFVAFCFTGVVLCSSACEGRRPEPAEPPFQMTERLPDLNFRLSAEQRHRAISGIDVDALERLLQRLPSAERDVVLSSFLRATPGTRQAPRMIGIAGSTDPGIAALFEEVWAPTWEHWGPEAIEKEVSQFPLPGREIARQRLGMLKKQPPERP